MCMASITQQLHLSQVHKWWKNYENLFNEWSDGIQTVAERKRKVICKWKKSEAH